MGVRQRPHPRPAHPRAHARDPRRARVPNYSLSPEAHYPTAIEETYAVLAWIANDGAAHGLDASRIAVVGDSVGGNMTAAITLMVKSKPTSDLAFAMAGSSNMRLWAAARLQPRGMNITPRTAWGDRPLLHLRPDGHSTHIV
jgi:acetyl esterase/lipase